MATDLRIVRNELANAIRAGGWKRVYKYVPSTKPAYPFVLVQLNSVEYNQTYNGSVTANMSIDIYANALEVEKSQDLVTAATSWGTADSVPNALMEYQNYSAVKSARIVSATDFGTVEVNIGEQSELAYSASVFVQITT